MKVVLLNIVTNLSVTISFNASNDGFLTPAALFVLKLTRGDPFYCFYLYVLSTAEVYLLLLIISIRTWYQNGYASLI